MEKLIAVITLEEEEGDDLLDYCMGRGMQQTFLRKGKMKDTTPLDRRVF